jgi:AraC family transcriptional regulator of adaptative response/methylated-DNA-[protein]-cysteine methyltransferase
MERPGRAPARRFGASRFERKRRGAGRPARCQNAFVNTKEIIMNAIGKLESCAAEELSFAFGAFSLGQVLVAVGAKGVTAILIGDSREALRRELDGTFPQAAVSHDEGGLTDVVDIVSAYLEAPKGEIGLPLDLRGSAVELAVWQALRAIPCGRTASYGEIAKSLPLPAKAQEVGAACAANRLAIVIPCHRVVKADGSISGYRWGVARKRKLIAREAA